MNGYYNSICILSWLTLFILGVLIHENARISARNKKRFYVTYLLIAVSLLAEWAGLRLSGQPDAMMGLLKIVKCADYIFTPMVGGALSAQIAARNKWNTAIIAIVAFNTVLQIISAFNGWMFFINSENQYSYGPLYPLYLIISLAIIIIVTVQFIIFGRKYRRRNQMSLYLILALVLLSISMQELLPSGSRTLYIGISIAMALLFIHVTEYSQMEADDNLTKQLVKVNTDALTGVFSRHAYSHALKNCNEMEVLPEDFVALSIDINELKRVNDNLGHEAGDELIIGAADCILKVIGESGSCYRTGGDEFVVLANLNRSETANVIRRLEEETKKWSGNKVKDLHLAVGCAMAADHPDLMAEKLVNKADIAMYAAKSAYYRSTGKGRDRYNYYDPLTGLPSMTYFFELAEAGQKTILSKNGTPVILFTDISGMNSYGHRYGLPAGDEMLRSFSRLLNQYFGIDHCCRFGQDYFAIYTSEDDLDNTLKRLFIDCRNINHHYTPPVHIGIYRNVRGNTYIRTAVDRAKAACDSLKNTDGSKFIYYEQI